MSMWQSAPMGQNACWVTSVRVAPALQVAPTGEQGVGLSLRVGL